MSGIVAVSLLGFAIVLGIWMAAKIQKEMVAFGEEPLDLHFIAGALLCIWIAVHVVFQIGAAWQRDDWETRIMQAFPSAEDVCSPAP